ncbi:MAG: Amuc_1100 family pilus-like protein [Verrucomicrobiae bacterium]|nr:Amuc_1100 family pilus-like protein [Verrucomicrobiae bacterium]
MSWVKRNLVWVVLFLLILLFILGSLLLLKTQIHKRDEVVSLLTAEKQEATRLLGKKNYPAPENVKQMKAENDRLEKEIGEVLTAMHKTQPPSETITGIKFRELLNKRTRQLSMQARKAGVSLPADFFFGFGKYEKTIPKDEDVPLLMQQLSVIEEICGAMFRSSPKVLLLDSLQRPEFEDVGGDDSRLRGHRGPDAPLVTAMPNGVNGMQNDPSKMYTIMPFTLQFAAEAEGVRNFLNELNRAKYVLIPAVINVKCDQTEVKTKAPTPEIGPDGKVVIKLPEDLERTEKSMKYVLGTEKVNVQMRINWYDFRQDEEPAAKPGFPLKSPTAPTPSGPAPKKP